MRCGGTATVHTCAILAACSAARRDCAAMVACVSARSARVCRDCCCLRCSYDNKDQRAPAKVSQRETSHQCIQTHKHTRRTPPHAHPHAHTSAHMHTRTRTHAYAHTRTHAHTHTRIHASTHPRIHKHTCSYPRNSASRASMTACRCSAGPLEGA